MDFIFKYKEDGSFVRFKAWLGAKGFTKPYTINYLETFALAAKLNTIWVLLSLGVTIDWPLHLLNVKNVILSGDLEEEEYVDIPLGIETEENTTKVYKMKKSLFGLNHLWLVCSAC